MKSTFPIALLAIPFALLSLPLPTSASCVYELDSTNYLGRTVTLANRCAAAYDIEYSCTSGKSGRSIVVACSQTQLHCPKDDGYEWTARKAYGDEDGICIQ